ncbi:MAG: NADH-quinone oxidoreductase subunit M [Phycisphaerales bacterium]|jgi:NADH-quinone oxidoreductase subunit M|nr:NADH-quinone oxidoreductase subunit M [Phycisphaerales bacterium]
MTPWLLLLLPLVGALVIFLSKAELSKWISLGVSLLVFVISILMSVQFGAWGSMGTGVRSSFSWVNQFGLTLDLGADSVAMMLVLLTTLLVPLCVWGSFNAINSRRREYYAWLLILETAMLGVFLAQDLILFYVSFELTLVPMFFLIAIYGGKNRAHASVKFFIYTFTGSLFMLAGFVYVAWEYALSTGNVWSFAIQDLTTFAATQMSSSEQAWILFALLAGFAVKIPVFPVHTWLPLAHTEAPTAGSVILAGVLLKLGTFGVYRFILPMVPEALVVWAPAIAVLAIVGILYAALICWVQDDIKKLIAYSSVSHLGFCVLGLVALNPIGLEGAVLYMINHGLSTGALFFLIGMMYERYHTRDMNLVGGLAKSMPIWSVFLVFFVLASVGLPGLNGFVSEFMCLLGTFIATGDAQQWQGVLGPTYAAVAALGMVLAAMYLLIMVGKIVFGSLKEPDSTDRGVLPTDLSLREIGVLVPLAVLCLWIGVQPTVLTDAMRGSVEKVLSPYPQIVEQYRTEQGNPIHIPVTQSTDKEDQHG